MKTLFLILLLTISLTGHAQGLKRQSILSAIPGIFNLIFSPDVPVPDYEIDFEDPRDMELMSTVAHSKELRFFNEESTFSFLNDEESFKNLFKKDLGVCRGYSSLRRKFRHLAFFDPENKVGTEVPDKEKQPKKYEQFYKKLVKAIRKGRPTIIPGYTNLKEFSSDPAVSDMIKWQVFHEWRRKNYSRHTGTGNLIMGAFQKSTYQELLNMRERVDQFSKNGLNTIIWLSVKKSTWIHVLEAVEVTSINESGEFVFKLWNDKSNELAKAYSYLTVRANGELEYDDFVAPTRAINAAGITRENDGEIQHLGNQLQTYFEKETNH